MWILLWLVLSAILIGATLWSLQILMRQKAAWDKYAKMKGFTFNRGTFMGPGEMNGVIGDYRLSFFTAERAGADVRTRRYVTVLEINLIDGLIDSGALGTKEMLPFLQTLDKLHPLIIEGAPFEEGTHVFAKSDTVMKAYLTQERIETLASILKTKNADTLVLFNEKEVVVRLETSDPMQDADKIDKIVNRLIALTEKLRITSEERARLMALA